MLFFDMTLFIHSNLYDYHRNIDGNVSHKNYSYHMNLSFISKKYACTISMVILDVKEQ